MLKRSLVIAALGTAVAGMTFATRAEAADPVLGALIGSSIASNRYYDDRYYDRGYYAPRYDGYYAPAAPVYYSAPYYAPAPAFGATIVYNSGPSYRYRDHRYRDHRRRDGRRDYRRHDRGWR
jgi:hypothetical protein